MLKKLIKYLLIALYELGVLTGAVFLLRYLVELARG